MGKQQQQYPGREGFGDHPAPAATLLEMEGSRVRLLGKEMAGASTCFQRHLDDLPRPRSLK